MIIFSISFVAGVVALQVQPRLPELWLAWGLTLLLPALGLPCRSLVGRSVRSIARCVLGLGAGFLWAAFLAGLRLAEELPTAWEGRDLRLVGVVAKLPQPFERGIRFEFDVERVLTIEATVPQRVLISWFATRTDQDQDQQWPPVRVGERWQLTARLRRPHGNANPHGFDYEAWLLERGIRATGYVRLTNPPQRLDRFVPWPGHVVERVREAIRARIFSALHARPYAGVIVALVMGDQRAIPTTQWTVFTRTGVNHLMSISGLHVTMIAAVVAMLTHRLWRRSPRLVTRWPARRAAIVAGLASALAYAAIAGFAVPAQRTVYMLAATSALLWLGRVSSVAAVVCVALLAVAVLDPWAVTAPGFWLSFGAVATILYVSAGRLKPSHWTLAWARTQWAVTIGLVPMLLVMFQQVSLISPLANAFAIPVVSLLIVPLALIGTVAPFDFVLQFAHALLDWTMKVLDALAAVPDAVWQQHAPLPWAALTAFAGIAWLLLPRGVPGRWVGVVLLVPMFTQMQPGPGLGALRVVVLDVGQGLAVVVRTASHALLYDAGPVYSAEANSGSRIVVPYLRAVGIRQLDGVIVTHADSDHAGGAGAVMEGVPVGWLMSSLPPSHPLFPTARTSMPCHAGQRWQWDGVRFEMLHPQGASYSRRPGKANDMSCVLRIDGGGVRVLLAGDAEARSEREMLARDPRLLRAEILVVPHHGSTTSSTPEFIAAVGPDTAVFTAGYRNRFGHPRPEVLQRYEDYGSRILRTDRHGALQFDVAERAVKVRMERRSRRRYWQDPPF